jgi:hypothetical protein
MKTEIEPCSECENTVCYIEPEPPVCFVKCPECGSQGVKSTNANKAIRLWNTGHVAKKRNKQ